MTASLRQAAGATLVVGLGGAELTGLDRAWLRLVQPAGIILFRRNITDAAQTRALLDEATGLCSAHAFRCIDVEGGTVDRLRDALAPLPSAQAVAQAASAAQKPALARHHGELVARAIQAFGFNTTLAPVVDLGLPASAAVMGTRTAAPAASGVMDYAREFLAGLKAHGVAGCAKHFPGLGGGVLDSHLDTPHIDRSLAELWSEDLVPYRELRDRLPMIMVNHAAYPRSRDRARPASISPYWIGTVLRKRIGYRGIAFSDDLEMGGILKFMPIENAAIAAIRAGLDLIEICHSPELILRAFEALLAEGERSTAFRSLLTARARRTRRLRAQLFRAGTSEQLTPKQFDALRTRIKRFAVAIQKFPEARPA